MNVTKIKKLTIVAERLLKEKIVAIIKDAGATGYTMVACEGEGSRGNHTADWEGRAVEIYTIAEEDVCSEILEKLEQKFMANFSIIAYVCNVEVVRNKKFNPQA